MTRTVVGAAGTGNTMARPVIRTNAPLPEKPGPAVEALPDGEPEPVVKAFVAYRSLLVETAPFDITLPDLRIKGRWSPAKTHLEFKVPEDRVPDVERHYFVMIGRVGRA